VGRPSRALASAFKEGSALLLRGSLQTNPSRRRHAPTTTALLAGSLSRGRFVMRPRATRFPVVELLATCPASVAEY